VAYPQIAAFARLANGAVAATRSIAGQATKIGRASHDIQYDEVNDEIVIASANGQAIVTLPGGANGDTPAKRIIQGPKTQIQSPGYGAAVDTVNNEIFLVEGRDRPGEEYILVFPRTANGDVAPIRVIKGPDTMMKNARSIAIDPVRNLIAVDSNNGLLIFPRTANGNVKPLRSIRGPGGNFRIIPEKGWIVAVADAGGDDEDERGIAVWNITDSGNVPPVFLLTNPNGEIGGGRVSLNPKGKEVILGGRTFVHVYSFPEIFD
jgi:hypothetical protein